MRTLASVIFAIATATLSAQAQDLPSRVGRVAYIDGRVSLYQDPDEGWEKAYVNSPITSENSLWADEGARAELRISGTAVRLEALTQLDLNRLADDEVDAFLARGSLAVRVRHLEQNERLTFNTPNTRVRLRVDGRYRIDYDPDRNETRVTVFAGEARVGSDESRIRLAPGRSVLVFGENPPEFVEESARTDAFDKWALARDERWTEPRSTTYVSSYMTGYEDLDANGTWGMEPDYGAIWYPSRVASDWAPYRYGHWDYVRPWGWTWVDDASWGYAPFHYGRWVYVRNRWAWLPGERTARPVWAPALVAWVGGSGFSVGVSGGRPVGWYPLTPYDRYQPWFNASPAYVNRVNVVVRNTQPRGDQGHWRDWTRERGTTVVDSHAMIARQPIARAAIRVSPEALRQARPVAQPSTVLPTRAEWTQNRRQQPQQVVAAPRVPATVTQQRQVTRPGTQPAQAPQAANAIVRPEFGRRAQVATPQAASAPPAQRPGVQERVNRDAAQAQERAAREAAQAQERAQREAAQRGQQQQQQQQEQQAKERAAREAAQAHERAQREAAQRGQQQQQQQEQQAKERAAREAAQAQERAQREAAQRGQQQQQQQEQQAKERAAREAAQAQERAQREAAQRGQQQQQQQEQQAKERAAREAAQAQERAQREAAQRGQQQQQAQERAQKEAQQAQERAAREAQQRAQQQQQQQQAQERAAREAAQAQQKAQQQQQQQQQQAQERAAREAAQAQERAAREAAQAQQRAQQAAQREKDKEKDKDKDKDKDKQDDKGRAQKQ